MQLGHLSFWYCNFLFYAMQPASRRLRVRTAAVLWNRREHNTSGREWSSWQKGWGLSVRREMLGGKVLGGKLQVRNVKWQAVAADKEGEVQRGSSGQRCGSRKETMG